MFMVCSEFESTQPVVLYQGRWASQQENAPDNGTCAKNLQKRKPTGPIGISWDGWASLNYLEATHRGIAR
jgi:hypothetical protein